MKILEQMTFNMAPGPYYEDDAKSLSATEHPLVKLIAFYLPQFHPIPENDAWWGKGFTEWTNVTKAVPRFEGHYQPRLPGELGFYNLTQVDVLRRQAELARKYGIAGFCFHHYWFSGRRLLEQPIELLISNPDIELPFCINWANESWTRRWDGNEKNILMQQKYSSEDDIAFARSIEPYFRDPRYIRIGGRPLLMLYRPGVLPDAAATVTRWRQHFVGAGFENPFIVMAQAFQDGDPAKYGMDAAAGFPPFWATSPKVQGVNLLDPKYDGTIVDYNDTATKTISSYVANKRVFPGVCPSWDNEARKPRRGFCFSGSTPAKYARWLNAACAASVQAFSGDERLVFINAWNEWAEGAYLEPDRHYGYAYLAETARVLNSLDEPTLKQLDLATSVPVSAQHAPLKLTAQQHLKRFARQTLNRTADFADNISYRLRHY